MGPPFDGENSAHVRKERGGGVLNHSITAPPNLDGTLEDLECRLVLFLEAEAVADHAPGLGAGAPLGKRGDPLGQVAQLNLSVQPPKGRAQKFEAAQPKGLVPLHGFKRRTSFIVLSHLKVGLATKVLYPGRVEVPGRQPVQRLDCLASTMQSEHLVCPAHHPENGKEQRVIVRILAAVAARDTGNLVLGLGPRARVLLHACLVHLVQLGRLLSVCLFALCRLLGRKVEPPTRVNGRSLR